MKQDRQNIFNGFDLEAECRRLGIWPEPGAYLPKSAQWREGMAQLVEAAMHHAAEQACEAPWQPAEEASTDEMSNAHSTLKDTLDGKGWLAQEALCDFVQGLTEEQADFLNKMVYAKLEEKVWQN